MFAVTNGYLDDVSVEKISEWEEGFHMFIESNYPKIAERIIETNEIDDETQKSLIGAIDSYKQTVSFN
jgi:F-type H+-transporting ATPase subunit alpha